MGLINTDFRSVLAEVCLECEFFKYGNCRVCVPTGAALFHDDPEMDVRLPDPCEAATSAEVDVIPIKIGEVDYFYSADSSSPFGYTFYTYRDDLGGYAPIDPSAPIINELLTAIK